MQISKINENENVNESRNENENKIENEIKNENKIEIEIKNENENEIRNENENRNEDLIKKGTDINIKIIIKISIKMIVL